MANIQIELLGGEDLNGVLRFDPNSLLSGRVTIIPDKDIDARSVDVWVEWHTEGRGDTDKGNLPPTTIYQGRMSAGVPFSQEFAVQLPPHPWSYMGHYVTIIWALMIKINIPLGNDITAAYAFVMRPGNPMVKTGAFIDEKQDPFASA